MKKYNKKSYKFHKQPSFASGLIEQQEHFSLQQLEKQVSIMLYIEGTIDNILNSI